MGLGAGLTALIASALPESLAFAAPELAGGLIGAGGGALMSGITGGNPLTGALAGGITGGFIPAGGALGADVGIGSTAGDVLGGLAGGALGAGITGGNLLEGTALGGLGGFGASLFSGPSASGGSGNLASSGATSTGGVGTAIPTTGAPTVSAPTLAGGGAGLSDFSGATDPVAAALAAGGDTSGLAAVSGGGVGGAIDPNTLAATLSGGATGTPATPVTGATPSATALLNAPSGGISPAQVSQFLTTGNISANPAAPTFSGGGGAGTGGPLSSITNFLKANPALTTGAGLLGSQLLSKPLQKASGVNNPTPAQRLLINSDQPALTAANQLIPSLASGTLPPGAQDVINQQLQQTIADIRSHYASLGMSGSSAEAQDIQNAQNASTAQQFEIANQATQTGLNALGLGEGGYQSLINSQLQNQQNLSQSMSNFFSSIGQSMTLANLLNPNRAGATQAA